MTELLSSFYNKLVKKSLAKLPDGVDTLILIPSGPLWYLPFSALIMTDQDGVPSGGLGTRSPYLVEKFILAYLPSLASLSSLTKGGAEAAGGVRLLALADPELSPDQLREGEGSKCGEEKPLERYEQLVAACQDFADLLVGKEQEEQCVYAGKEAQEVRAHEETGRQVVVYAAHGQFNPYVPLQSKLLLAPGGKAANLQTDSRVLDGNYHAWETLLTDYRGTELVVLAACETLLPHLRDMQGALAVLSDQECDQVELTPQQLEQIVVGDEVVGLARAFLSSGAEAVLGTLWLANPTAIGKLLMSMAEYHKEGDTWVQALTKAQRELIKGNTFKNPWFWAPYQLIGRWR
jgi:CHAT domain-containing protein